MLEVEISGLDELAQQLTRAFLGVDEEIAEAVADKTVEVREQVMTEGHFVNRRGRSGGILGATVKEKTGPASYAVGPDAGHEGQERGLAHTRIDIGEEAARRMENGEAERAAEEVLEKRLRLL